MHKSRLGTLVIDCQTDDLEQAAEFWRQALGKARGRSDDKYAWLDGGTDEPRIIVQKVSHASRVHIDIETDDIEAEVARLTSLGAEVVERLPRWVIMQAPTGQRFCIIGPVRDDFNEHANCWDPDGKVVDPQ